MNNKYMIAAFALVLLLTGCKQAKVTGSFGDPIDAAAQTISPDDLLTALDSLEAAPVIVKGKISSVCHAEGCWITFNTKDGQKIFVNVKDKAFHLSPKVEGHTATAIGEVWSVKKQQEDARAQGWTEEEVNAISGISVEATGIVVE